MKNYQPKVRELKEYHVEALNKLGFYVPCFIGKSEEVKLSTNYFEKRYYMCGGGFNLCIRLSGHYFGDKYCKPMVKIETPYDSWWHDMYNVKDFTDEVRYFYEELNNDIGALKALGIIEEEKDTYDMDFETYIIQSIDENVDYRYHKGNGNMTNDIKQSEFYSSYESAESELSKFDEPEDFEIKEIIVAMKFNEKD